MLIANCAILPYYNGSRNNQSDFQYFSSLGYNLFNLTIGITAALYYSVFIEEYFIMEAAVTCVAPIVQ